MIEVGNSNGNDSAYPDANIGHILFKELCKVEALKFRFETSFLFFNFIVLWFSFEDIIEELLQMRCLLILSFVSFIVEEVVISVFIQSIKA